MLANASQRSQGEPLEGGDGTIDDLKQALVENLEHRGVLGKLRAKVGGAIDGFIIMKGKTTYTDILKYFCAIPVVKSCLRAREERFILPLHESAR